MNIGSRKDEIVTRLCVYILGVALFVAPSGIAHSQSLADSFSGFSPNSTKPVEIQSDQLEVQDEENTALFTGDVVVIQDDTTLTTRALKVFYAGEGSVSQQQIEKLEARGDVVMISPAHQVKGQWADFDMRTEIVTMGDDVVLTEGGSVLTGNQLTVNLKTGRSKLRASGTKGGRVQGLFQSKPAQ